MFWIGSNLARSGGTNLRQVKLGQKCRQVLRDRCLKESWVSLDEYRKDSGQLA